MIKLTYDKYLVTGGAGFIGSHIGEEIIKQGKQLVVIDNFSSGKMDNLQPWWNDKLCILVKDDIRESHKFSLSSFKNIDIVFHEVCAMCTTCFTNPHQDLSVNAWGSWCVFEASKQTNVRKVIHASTGSVMNGKPVSFYGVSKLAGESYLYAFKDYYPDFRYTSLRYYNVYGTRQDNSDIGGVIPIFIRQILINEPITIYGTGKQMRRFTNVKDVVNANFLSSENSKTDNGVFDVVSYVHISILELANLLYKLMNEKPNIRFADRRPGDIDDFDVNPEKFRRFGWESNVDFVEGLQQTINWYAKQL